jgi:hypothetical protein
VLCRHCRWRHEPITGFRILAGESLDDIRDGGERINRNESGPQFDQIRVAPRQEGPAAEGQTVAIGCPVYPEATLPNSMVLLLRGH